MMFWHSRKRRERDLERELQDHLDLEAASRLDTGLAPTDAWNAARRTLGNQTLIQEVTREMWGWTSFERLFQDLRYAARMLWKSPGFSTVAVLSLALGIGANTAIFSLLNAVVLRSLPVTDPEQLVQFSYTLPGPGPNNWNSWMGYPHFERFQARTQSFSGIFGGAGAGRVNMVHRGASGMASGDAYTANFFSVMGISPQLGRLFAAGDDTTDGSALVLSDRYWQRRFGGDPSIVGQTVTVNQVPFTVVGVTPPQFSGVSLGSAPDFWIPLHATERLRPEPKKWTAAFNSWMLIAGRLRPDVALPQAQAEADVLHRQLIGEQLESSDFRNSENMRRFVRESHLVLRPAAGGMFSGVRDTYSLPLKLLMAVSGIVVLIACANVANLLLARASHRRREIALRLALGAGRTRVIRQLLTEGLLLAGLGGVIGLAFSWWGSNTLVRMISTGEMPMPLDVRPDWQVLGFATGVSLLTGILFGLAPALRGTRVDPGTEMKDGSRQAGRSSRVIDRVLVVAQVSLSLVLVAGAGLFARTLQNLWSIDLGFNREDVLMFSVSAKSSGHTPQTAGGLYRDILQRLQAMPDVRSVSASYVRPVDDNAYFVDGIGEVDGQKLEEQKRIRVAYNVMAPGYFQTIGLPLLLGRDFDLRDNETAPKVAIVNEPWQRRPSRTRVRSGINSATLP
jgi:predicted permease